MNKWLSDKRLSDLDEASGGSILSGVAVSRLVYQAKEANRLTKILHAHGICPTCEAMYSHCIDEPFASCQCGTSEWYDFTPYMRLEAEISRMRLSIRQLAVELCEKPWHLDPARVADRLEGMLDETTASR